MNKDDVARALMRKKLSEEMTHQPFQPMTPVEDTWGSMNTLQKMGFLPGVGDVAGFAGDVQSMYQNPEERTMGNAGLAGLGLLPFVPAGMGTVKRAYENTPDTLMGFRKSGENKGFDEENYSKTVDVLVKWPDGTSHADSIKGLNTPHALERARRNWEGAEIEEIGNK